jgi:hypothetical protein
MTKISRSVHFSKQAKKMMTVQSVQCHVEADCIGRTTIQMMWQGMWMLTWTGTGGPIKV